MVAIGPLGKLLSVGLSLVAACYPSNADLASCVATLVTWWSYSVSYRKPIVAWSRSEIKK